MFLFAIFDAYMRESEILLCMKNMIIKNLDIVNYKNIAAAQVECCRGFNCFIGKNGTGKTNVLDAIYHLSMCKSYFNLPDTQNIRHGETFFVLQGNYEREGEEIKIYCGVKRGQKKLFRKNQKVYDRLSDHIGLLPLVVISPADSVLIDGGSEERRRFIDGVISQYDKDYLVYLIRYNRILNQRNCFLKEYAGRRIDPDMLSVWDEQLADSGKVILHKRRAFIQELGEIFQQYYERISSGQEQVTLSYSTTVKNEDVLRSLQENFERDRVLTYTTVGIHRDDILLESGNYPVKKLGSQGQKKSYLTALKFAQFTYLSQKNQIKPLLLLDDIFDKLDADRVAQIVRLVAGDTFGQVFITDTNREHIDEILQTHAVAFKIFEMEKGNITVKG